MNGAELIKSERQRQIKSEGFDSEHDREYGSNQLTRAAIVYTKIDKHNVEDIFKDPLTHRWPWGTQWLKPFSKCDPTQVDRIRCLTKAGALIAAEIDRLQEIQTEGGEG
jgi:hypothetical protein